MAITITSNGHARERYTPACTLIFAQLKSWSNIPWSAFGSARLNGAHRRRELGYWTNR